MSNFQYQYDSFMAQNNSHAGYSGVSTYTMGTNIVIPAYGQTYVNIETRFPTPIAVPRIVTVQPQSRQTNWTATYGFEK